MLKNGAPQGDNSQPDRSKGKTIILDDNFYLRSMRKPYFQLARETRTPYKTVVVGLNAPWKLLQVRNERRAKVNKEAFIPEFVLEHMFWSIEYPRRKKLAKDERFPEPSKCWEAYTETFDFLYVDGESLLGDMPLMMLRQYLARDDDAPRALAGPLEKVAEEQPKSHVLDQQLRKVIAGVMNAGKKGGDLGEKLAKMKEGALKEFDKSKDVEGCVHDFVRMCQVELEMRF